MAPDFFVHNKDIVLVRRLRIYAIQKIPRLQSQNSVNSLPKSRILNTHHPFLAQRLHHERP